MGTENDCSTTESGFMSKLYEDCSILVLSLMVVVADRSSISNSNTAVNSNYGERVFDLKMKALSSNSTLESMTSVFESRSLC